MFPLLVFLTTVEGLQLRHRSHSTAQFDFSNAPSLALDVITPIESDDATTVYKFTPVWADLYFFHVDGNQ